MVSIIIDTRPDNKSGRAAPRLYTDMNNIDIAAAFSNSSCQMRRGPTPAEAEGELPGRGGGTVYQLGRFAREWKDKR